MSATTVKLLQAAAEIAGGEEALAQYLGIQPAVLSLYMADTPPVPDQLLLRAVDIILEDRQAKQRVSAKAARLLDADTATLSATKPHRLE